MYYFILIEFFFTHYYYCEISLLSTDIRLDDRTMRVFRFVLLLPCIWEIIFIYYSKILHFNFQIYCVQYIGNFVYLNFNNFSLNAVAFLTCVSKDIPTYRNYSFVPRVYYNILIHTYFIIHRISSVLPTKAYNKFE